MHTLLKCADGIWREMGEAVADEDTATMMVQPRCRAVDCTHGPHGRKARLTNTSKLLDGLCITCYCREQTILKGGGQPLERVIHRERYEAWMGR